KHVLIYDDMIRTGHLWFSFCIGRLARKIRRCSISARSLELLTSKRLMFGSLLQNGLRRFSHFCVSARGSAPLFRKFRIYPALIGIFLTVVRLIVRWTFIAVGHPSPTL